jgi:hypothetical protein
LRNYQTGGNHGSRSFALADRYTDSDYPSYLDLRRASLNGRAVQFVVLKREGKWVLKANDQERFSGDTAIRLANDSGKEGKPGAVLFQKSKSKFEKIWTYGEDPYPPARSDLPGMSGTPEPATLGTWQRTDLRRHLPRKGHGH